MTPIGALPTKASLDTSGLTLTDAQLDLLLSVDPDIWLEEAATIPSNYERFGARLPSELWDEHAALVERLERAQAAGQTHIERVAIPAE